MTANAVTQFDLDGPGSVTFVHPDGRRRVYFSRYILDEETHTLTVSGIVRLFLDGRDVTVAVREQSADPEEDTTDAAFSWLDAPAGDEP